jgi:hypothetical protein
MYEDGEGVQQNYVMAAKWYRKAAERVPDFGGARQGRNNLGLLYLNGLGVPKDLVHAYTWFSWTGSQTNLLYAKAEPSSGDTDTRRRNTLIVQPMVLESRKIGS